MPVFRVDVLPLQRSVDAHLEHQARQLGLTAVRGLLRSRYYLLDGDLDDRGCLALAQRLLCDPVIERASLTPAPPAGRVIEIQRKAGVMDPAEGSIIKGAADLGVRLQAVKTGVRVEVPAASDQELERLAWKCLANQAVEEVAIDPAQAVRLASPAGRRSGRRIEIPLRSLDDQALQQVSTRGQLSLTLEEMRCIQAHYRAAGREPSDIELETIAQTWSEHCVHKTLKGLVSYTGPRGEHGPTETIVIDNLLKQTIAKATHEIAAPWCLSVFVDNSGVIAFDDAYGVCIKVETHNRPSAIEPYGGANTGLGGVIRDVIGTGIGARPICSTDVFCFGGLETPSETLPPGTIHPRRLMRAVVSGVRDYGNRMGIPTVNGAIRFDDRYIGNPLVFCGTVGLIPRGAISKAAQVGDHILVIGGRTGRDGIHGATFSSAELTEQSEVVSSGAVQIGNAIEEKKVLEGMLQARDAGCFHAITDCGAGGLSSAVGEMAATHGCEVHLERVPLKYEGLAYWEIWVSESQERMVAAVPADRLADCQRLLAAEGVEATDIGTVTGTGRAVLRWHGEVVGDLDMHFLHDGVPRLSRPARFQPIACSDVVAPAPADQAQLLTQLLARPNIASKEWVIRQYDHEVQGGSIVKPLVGAHHDGPSDAAVVAPIPGSSRGIALGCGFNPSYADIDAWAAAAAGIEEALRNLVCVGASLERVAILDNFSWAKCTDPDVFGALVRACQACYELARYFGTPFVSGKDSLSNEFVFQGRTIRIPHTLLITALTVMPDVRQAITMDAKRAGDHVLVLGWTGAEFGGSELHAALRVAGGQVPRLDRSRSKPLLDACARLTAQGLIASAHDCSEGGLGVALAETAFSGDLGMDLDLAATPRQPGLDRLDRVLYSESLSRLVVTVHPEHLAAVERGLAGIPHARLGVVTASRDFVVRLGQERLQAPLARLKDAWQSPLRVMEA